MRRRLAEKTAVKDVIEACGVPHPEVDLIVVADMHSGEWPRCIGRPAQTHGRVAVFGVPAPADIS